VEPTADPAALEAAARALQQVAQNLDAQGLTATFARQASASSWTGHAAQQFRTAVTTDASTASGLAGDLRAIASMIEAGARKVRQIRAQQAKLLAQQQGQSNAPSRPVRALP